MYKEGMHNIHVIDRQNSKIEDMMSDTIFVIAQTIDAKDSYTKGHSKRVALYSKIIAIKLGHSVEFCENIYKVGFLHDIGKMGIADQILNKPDKLTDEEYAIMKSHVNIGAKIVKEITKMITLSTAHITENTAKKLDSDPTTNCLGLCVYKKSEYGWYITIDSNSILKAEIQAIPQDLARLILFARDLDCETLCLDCDAEEIPYFEVYEW